MNALTEILCVLRLYGVQERRTYEFVLVNAFVVPATIAYLGSRVITGDPDQLRWWMAGSIAFGLGMGGLPQVGYAILNDRFLGRLDLIRTHPVSKRAYFTAQVSVSVLQSLALILVGLLVFSVLGVAEPTPAGLAASVVTALCAGAAIGGLGAAIALRASEFDTGSTLIAISALGLAAASPVFYDIDALPTLMRPIAWLSPFTHIAELLRAVLAGQPPPPAPLAATTALALLLNAGSYRLARWSE